MKTIRNIIISLVAVFTLVATADAQRYPSRYLKDIFESHGFMSFKDSAVTITVSADSTWYSVTSATGTLWTSANMSGMSEAGDSITISEYGDYTGVLSLSFSATASDTIEIGIEKNNSLATGVSRVSTIGTETVNVSLPFYLNALEPGDDLVPVIQQLVNTDNIKVLSGSLLIRRQQ